MCCQEVGGGREAVALAVLFLSLEEEVGSKLAQFYDVMSEFIKLQILNFRQLSLMSRQLSLTESQTNRLSGVWVVMVTTDSNYLCGLRVWKVPPRTKGMIC